MVNRQVRYKRRPNNDGFLYREGPSSIEDERSISGSKPEDDVPRGLNEYIPQDKGKVTLISELAGSEVLLVYFAKLAKSHRDTTVDLEYLDTLIKSGAKVNYTDVHGQTVLHEVSIRWPVEVAEFFLQNGADLNQVDVFGRTPLHGAASVNYPAMVKWLIENGADMHCRSAKENQTPIHFAAKYNAIEAMVVLIENGSRLDDRDHKERTPLQLAAETGREEACRLLMEHGAPAGVYDDTGTSCLTHMIEKMPDVAAEALEQFQRIDKASRTVYYFLSYLECEKWTMLRNKSKGLATRVLRKREPLEAIIQNNESRLIMHPVIQRLLAKKTELYGRRNFLTNLLINFVFTAIWTALTVTLPGPKEKDSGVPVKFYDPIDEKAWRVALEALGLLLAIYFVFKIKIDSAILKRDIELYKAGRIQEIKRDTIFCHPRWPLEGKFVKEEIQKVQGEGQASLYDVWFWFDVLSFLGLLMLMITRVMLVSVDYGNFYKDVLEFHYHAYPFVLIIIWLRFMQGFRPFITLGPFIAMLGYVASDTLKFAFLFCEFFIPYCCAIWIVFGHFEEETAFSNFNDLMFEVLRMTVVDSFAYEDLTKQNKLVAQLICGTYLALTSITCLNLYIALLSETFSRVFGNATATAYMLQGEALISLEKKLPKTSKHAIKQYIADNCSPEAVYGATEGFSDDNSAVRDIMSEMENLKRQCNAIKKLQQQMKPQANFFQTEAIDIMTQQDELMEDIEESLKQMTEE